MPKKALNAPAKRRDGRSAKNGTQSDGAPSRGALVADIIIANAPDPVFVSDLEGKILQANDADKLRQILMNLVSVASHEGKGSTFCVDLPLAASTNGS